MRVPDGQECAGSGGEAATSRSLQRSEHSSDIQAPSEWATSTGWPSRSVRMNEVMALVIMSTASDCVDRRSTSGDSGCPAPGSVIRYLKSKIGHNIGFQTPFSPPFRLGTNTPWYTVYACGVELRSVRNRVQNDVIRKLPYTSCSLAISSTISGAQPAAPDAMPCQAKGPI